MVETILSSPFFKELVLPFLLVFALIFAILDRTKILGEEKRQTSALIAFVIGLLLIAFPFPRNIIVNLMPLLAVVAVIILVFIMLFAFASGEKEFKMPKGLKIIFGILIGIVLIIALAVFSGYGDVIINALLGGQGKEIVINVLFILVIVGAIAIVLVTDKKGGASS